MTFPSTHFNPKDPNTPITAAWLNAVNDFIAGGGGGGITPHTFTATEGQTVFPVTGADKGLLVSLNSALLTPVVDYTATATAVTLTAGAPVGHVLVVYTGVTAGGGGGSGGGDMYKAVYDPTDSGFIQFAQTQGVQATLPNAGTLAHITEAAGQPLWYGGAWPSSGGGGGEVNTASNLGTGVGVYDSKAGVDLRFRSLKQSGPVTITNNGDGTISIDAPTALTTAGGSTTGPLFVNDRNGGSVDVRDLALHAGATGIHAGGTLTLPTSTTITVAAGNGQILHVTSDPFSYTVVTWATQTITNTGIGSPFTYVMINAAGTVYLQVTEPTMQQYCENIYVGVVANVAGAQVASAPRGESVKSLGNQVQEYFRMSGAHNVKDAIKISANGATTSLKTSAGNIWRVGANVATSLVYPNTIAITAKTPVSVVQYYTDSSGNIQAQAGLATTLNTSQYNNAGTLTTIATNRWQIMRFYMSTNGNGLVLLGSTLYTSQSSAASAVLTEQFTEPPLLADQAFIGWLVVKGQTTDLSNTTDNTLLNATRFGVSGGAPATGEANTASNLGSGVGLYSQKVGVDLQFKSIVNTATVTVTDNGNGTVGLTATGGGSTGQDTILDWLGGEASIGVTSTSNFSCVELVTGTYLVLYYNGSFLRARVVTVSGTTPTAGAEQTLWSTLTPATYSVAVISATSVVVGYGTTASGDMFAVGLTVSGNTVTYGTPVAAGTGAGTSLSVQTISLGGSKFLLAGLNAANLAYVIAGTVSAGVVTFGTLTTGLGAAQGYRLGYTAVADTAVIMWSTASTEWATVVSVSGNDATLNTAVTLLTVSDGVPIYISKQSSVYTAYIVSGNTITCYHFTVSGTAPTFVGRSVLQPSALPHTFTWVIENSNGKGVNVLGTTYSGTANAAYRSATSLMIQQAASFVRETSGTYVGTSSPSTGIVIAGASATKLAAFPVDSTTLRVKVLTERNI